MDQIKIGKFIADERKRKGYTQKQLSEKLAISDKTIFYPTISLIKGDGKWFSRSIIAVAIM